jgi:predicted DsbA family dithiol-disulfide isomerase
MIIEIWSDFACPYCYIGEKKLEKAIAEMALDQPIDIRFKSFQLDVNAVSHAGEDINNLIAKKYGMPYEQAKAANNQIVAIAKDVGLDFDFDQIKPGNTGQAHELFKHADSVGKGEAMAEKLFAAYFEKGLDISNTDNLLELASAIGLDGDEVSKVFDQKTYKDQVLADQKTAGDMGINSVPFFVINNQYTVSGAQSVEHFKMALEKAMEN